MDVVVAGGGEAAKQCREALLAAGLRVLSEPFEGPDCPVILGDLPDLFGVARDLIEARRHLLIVSPASLQNSELVALLAIRKPRQAVLLWSERRQHPAYRSVASLTHFDAGWAPRHVRHTMLSPEPSSGDYLRWRTSESLALVIELAGREPESAAAFGSLDSSDGAIDFLSVHLGMGDVDGFVYVGVSEGVERRETVVAANDRKAYIDELSTVTPLQLLDARDAVMRLAPCESPDTAELLRLQCFGFLEALDSPARSQSEADVWLSALGCWEAIEESLKRSAEVEVKEPNVSGLRVLSGRNLADTPISPQLRIVR